MQYNFNLVVLQSWTILHLFGYGAMVKVFNGKAFTSLEHQRV